MFYSLLSKIHDLKEEIKSLENENNDLSNKVLSLENSIDVYKEKIEELFDQLQYNVELLEKAEKELENRPIDMSREFCGCTPPPPLKRTCNDDVPKLIHLKNENELKIKKECNEV